MHTNVSAKICIQFLLILYIALDDYDNIPEAGSGSGSGSGSGQELYGMETVTLQDGEPYLIPCDVGLVSIPSHIQWFRNGKPANQTMVRY